MTSYLPTFVGLLFILINIALFFYQDSKTNSPSLITGFNDGGFNGFSVDFKTNGTYIMANGSGLGQSYFYGKYSLKDSIITIDKSDIDNCIKSNRLVIRTEQYYLPLDINSKAGAANYITQIDKKGNEIEKDFRFRVTSAFLTWIAERDLKPEQVNAEIEASYQLARENLNQTSNKRAKPRWKFW